MTPTFEILNSQKPGQFQFAGRPNSGNVFRSKFENNPEPEF